MLESIISTVLLTGWALGYLYFVSQKPEYDKLLEEIKSRKK